MPPDDFQVTRGMVEVQTPGPLSPQVAPRSVLLMWLDTVEHNAPSILFTQRSTRLILAPKTLVMVAVWTIQV